MELLLLTAPILLLSSFLLARKAQQRPQVVPLRVAAHSSHLRR